MYYNKCPECGANLDPGEHCDCKEEKAKMEKRMRMLIREGRDKQFQMDLGARYEQKSGQRSMYSC